ncbi:hypothetical protein XaC1_533 [Xanthomonas phage XaC1]|nr:hypothetical protein XaC1_533 [Xanthomonas phage XaC1]
MKNHNKIIEEFWKYFEEAIESDKKFHSFYHIFTMDIDKYNIVLGSDYFIIRIQNDPIVAFNDTKDLNNYIITHDFPLKNHTPYFKSHDEYFNYSLENECVLTWDSILVIDKIIDKIHSMQIPFKVQSRQI